MRGIIVCAVGSSLSKSKGNIYPAGATSPYSLYNEDIASFGDSKELYSHSDAEGFINLYGLPLKVRAMMLKENGEKYSK